VSARVACAIGWTLVNSGLGVWARNYGAECGHADGECQPPTDTDAQADGFKTLGESPLPLTDGEFAQQREEQEIAAEVAKLDEFETIHERAHAGVSDPDACTRGEGCPAFLPVSLVLPRVVWLALIACAEIGLEGAHDASSLSPEALDGVEEALRQLRWLVK
jgi:hypothetical protein